MNDTLQTQLSNAKDKIDNLLKENAELRNTLSENNKFFGEQMMFLNKRVADLEVDEVQFNTQRRLN